MGDVRWREFELHEIFETVPFRGGLQVPTGGLVKSSDLREGLTPRVTVTSLNNGVGGFYEDVDDVNYRVYENCISVSFLGTVFYHPYRASFDMKVHCLKPIGHSFGLDALFVVAALRKHLANNGYFNQTKSTDLPYMRIELPSRMKTLPDWQTLALVCGGGGVDMSNIDTSSWQEFKLKDLFEASNGDTDIKKSDLDGQGLLVVTSGVANYGIAGWSSVAAREFDANTITVDMFGNVMYRSEPYKMVTHARVFSLSLKDEYSMSEQVGLYLVGALSKLTEGYGFNDMCSWSKICDKSILLPAMTVDEPDWDYMAECIAELEAERIAELEAYLVATGLDDCELTDEDREVLGREVETKEFRVGELFELINNPQLDKHNFVFDESAEYPYFTRTENNNGVLGYVRYLDDKHKISGNSLAVGMISMRFHYMPHDFYAGQFTKTLLPKFDEFNEQLALYFIAELNARSGYYQGYLVREFATRVLETELELPVTSAGTPDWDYMRAYIRAQEKLVMAGVADMTQERIDATREIVGV